MTRGRRLVFTQVQVYKWVLAKPSRGVGGGGRNTASRFMPLKPEISAALMGTRLVLAMVFLTLSSVV